MFKKTRKKLTLFYAVCFSGFFFVFLVVLYFSLLQLMDHQQIQELETYYDEQYHDFFEYMGNEENKIDYQPNRMYFYYIYTKEQKLVHGDESYKGLYKEIENIYPLEDTSESSVKRIQWNDEHFLLLSKPVQLDGDVLGYIVLGKSTTSQYHFFQKMIILFIVLVVVFTLFIGLISYYMAGKAMVPIENALEKQRNFVSDASHELRTPLSVFYSSLDILESEESKNVSEFGKELIKGLKDEAELMKDLLEKLLFLARHDQNRLEVTKELFSLTDLLVSISEKFQRTLREDLSFQTEITPGVDLMGDSKKVIELIYVLLENAVQYTPHGSIFLKLIQTDEDIQIIVEDTGIGIAKDELPRIFDRFFRSDAARKRDGTGLGLSIADAIVKEHGGVIQVKSDLGKGTRFCIQFPSSKS